MMEQMLQSTKGRRPKLGMDALYTLIVTYNMGIHSHIPECCVREFVRRWFVCFQEGTPIPTAKDVYAGYGNGQRAGSKGNPEYVMCKGCSDRFMSGERGHLVNVHHCNPKSPKCRTFYQDWKQFQTF